MASYVIARLKANSLEIQIKVAADSAWPLVQELSPGAVFVSEEFETVGRPLLIALGKTMDTLTIDGKTVEPSHTDVVLAEDTFLFGFTYPLPPGRVLQLKETYLHKMPPDYASHIRVFDTTGVLVASKDLNKENVTFEFALPAVKSVSSGAPANRTKG